ncbi:MAG: hypothetical protein IJO59_07715 [Clostridia bacterium]|nr:hypothetical protein [Clostridia bacterium]
MNGLAKAVASLPRELQERFLKVPLSQANEIQEIRLRCRQPITVTGRGKTWFLSRHNTLTDDSVEVVFCEDDWVRQTIDNACSHSLYAHQEELRKGFVTTREGCRIGVCGTAVLQQDEVISFRDITSLCLRVLREHCGCAEELLPLLYKDERAHSALICGEPACGKSSLLVDVMRGFSKRGLYPAVIDERGELKESAISLGCDVLCGIPKTQGVEQAVRCLAPPLILLDELGGEAEIAAVTKSLYRGVLSIATIHCRDAQQLLHIPALKTALENDVFEYLIVLSGRERPGCVHLCVKTKEWLHEGGRVVAGHCGGHDVRRDGACSFEKTRNSLD